MRAMLLEAQRTPLRYVELPDPEPGPAQLLVRVHACGVCRTDLHVLDGDLTQPKLPLVPGHQVVGEVVGAGKGVTRFKEGDRVGIAWLGWACGTAASATPAGRTSARTRASPATRSTAATP